MKERQKQTNKYTKQRTTEKEENKVRGREVRRE
jgi:hypothetical protein